VTVRASIELELPQSKAFDDFVVQLSDSLEAMGIEFSPTQNSEVVEGKIPVGRVVTLDPPNKIEIEWHTAATWDPKDSTKLKLEFESVGENRTKVIVENEGWGNLVGNTGTQLSEWFAEEIASNLIKATSPERFVSWLTDKRARRPSGREARQTYRDPIYHRPNFLAILDYLKLGSYDYLLEVGCGGGAFLLDALKSGCKAAAIDHSHDMVRLAKEVNSLAVEENRLEVRESEADTLPFSDDIFTCAVSTGAFSFFDRPEVVLSEIRRVLRNNGRLIVFTGSKDLRGTPAAPEPIASQLRFYEDEELVTLARKAGFGEAKVERPSLLHYAESVGVPKEALSLFSSEGGGGQFLIARKV
jgi:SAM-dependent methyltransferase